MQFDLGFLRARPEGTPRQTRIEGALMLVLGLFAAAVAAALVVGVLGVAVPEHWLPAGMRQDTAALTGTMLERALTPAGLLVGFLLAVIAVIFLLGLWQLIFGRRNRALLRILVVMVAMLMIAGAIASILQGDGGRVGQ